MIRRLWLLLSLAWGALFFWNTTTRTVFSFTAVDAALVFGPFALGVLLPALLRYIVTGYWRRPMVTVIPPKRPVNWR